MAEKYVVDGAMLLCSNGSVCVFLQVEEDRKIKINGKYVANKSDVFEENIPDFGTCKALGGLISNPDGREFVMTAMTQFDGSVEEVLVRDDTPCELKTDHVSRSVGGEGILTPWLDCKDNVLIADHPAVLESSYIMCTAGGGTITVEDTGQDE